MKQAANRCLGRLAADKQSGRRVLYDTSQLDAQMSKREPGVGEACLPGDDEIAGWSSA